MKAIGGALQALRQCAGLTIDDAAILANTSSSYLFEVETGGMSCAPPYVRRVSEAISRYLVDTRIGALTHAEAIDVAREARLCEEADEAEEATRVAGTMEAETSAAVLDARFAGGPIVVDIEPEVEGRPAFVEVNLPGLTVSLFPYEAQALAEALVRKAAEVTAK